MAIGATTLGAPANGALWVGFACMTISALVFLFITYTSKHKSATLFNYLTTAVVSIASLAYLIMALGNSSFAVAGGRQFLWIRYVRCDEACARKRANALTSRAHTPRPPTGRLGAHDAAPPHRPRPARGRAHAHHRLDRLLRHPHDRRRLRGRRLHGHGRRLAALRAWASRAASAAAPARPSP